MTMLEAIRRAAVVLLLLFTPAVARADDAGDAGDAGDTADAGDDAAPIACDGGLCDTTNGSGCNVSGVCGDAGLAVASAALALGVSRRRRKR